MQGEYQKTHFYCEVDPALAEIVEGQCGVSLFGDTKKLSGRGHGL